MRHLIFSFVIFWLYIQMGEVPSFFQGLSVRGRNWSDEIPSPTLPKVFQYHFNIQLLVVSLAEEKVQKSKKKWGKGSKKYQENLLPLIHSGVLPWWPTYIHIFSSSANAKLGTTLLNQFQEKNWICEFKVDQLGLGWQFITSWSWCWIAIPGRQIYEGSCDTGRGGAGKEQKSATNLGKYIWQFGKSK